MMEGKMIRGKAVRGGFGLYDFAIHHFAFSSSASLGVLRGFPHLPRFFEQKLLV
jgi:hypothetical protein